MGNCINNRNDEEAVAQRRKNGWIVGAHVGGGAPGCGGSWRGGSSLWPPGCLVSGAHLSMVRQAGEAGSGMVQQVQNHSFLVHMLPGTFWRAV